MENNLSQIELEKLGPVRDVNDAVIAWRKDGLCVRLLAVLNGKLIAEHFGLQFLFSWPDQAALRANGHLNYAEPEGLKLNYRDLFSESMLRDYHLDYRHVGMLKIDYFQKQNSVKFGLTLNSKTVPARRSGLPFWLAPTRATTELRSELNFEQLPEIFRNSLFSDRVIAAFQEIDALTLPKKRIAIHLRSGDVVYSSIRVKYDRPQARSLNFAVVNQLCAKYSALGYGVFVAGANTKELSDLSAAYENVFTAADLNLRPESVTIDVLRDVYLMAHCASIFAAMTSAVSGLAGIVGPAKFQTVRDEFSLEQEQQILKDFIITRQFDSVHPLQRAYILYGLFHISPAESFETLDALLVRAIGCDPDNPHYLAVRVLNAFAHSQISLAKRFEEDCFDLFASIRRLRKFNPDIIHLKVFLRVDNPRMRDLLQHAQTAEGVPTRTRNVFARWLSGAPQA